MLLSRLRGNPSDEAAVAAARKALTQKLDILDRILSEQAYMAGQTFSLVDIFYMPTINGLFRAGEAQLIMARPHLDDWWNRLTERPSWKKVVEMYHAK
jgi:glutathione S-transferase